MKRGHFLARIGALASWVALVSTHAAHRGCTHAGSKTDGVRSQTHSSGNEVVVGTDTGPDFNPPQNQIVIHNMASPPPELAPITDPAIRIDPTLRLAPRPPEEPKVQPAPEQPKE